MVFIQHNKFALAQAYTNVYAYKKNMQIVAQKDTLVRYKFKKKVLFRTAHAGMIFRGRMSWQRLELQTS